MPTTVSLSSRSTLIGMSSFNKNLVDSTLQVGNDYIDVTQLGASTNAQSNCICCNVVGDATCKQDRRQPDRLTNNENLLLVVSNLFLTTYLARNQMMTDEPANFQLTPKI